jgi:hypothetical protein
MGRAGLGWAAGILGLLVYNLPLRRLRFRFFDLLLRFVQLSVQSCVMHRDCSVDTKWVYSGRSTRYKLVVGQMNKESSGQKKSHLVEKLRIV